MKPGEQVGTQVRSAQLLVRDDIWAQLGPRAAAQRHGSIWDGLQNPVRVVLNRVSDPARRRIRVWPPR